jgi:predicted DNA-binding transcriptional regulator YafY
MSDASNLAVRFRYKNHRGEVSERHVEPVEIYFGWTSWHKEPQWLLKAWDYDKKDYRDFAMKDIMDWRAA